MLKTLLLLLLASLTLYGAQNAANRDIDLLFFGAFGMIVIYNFIYYIIHKSSVYAYYFIFHLFVLIIMLFYTGMLDDSLLEFSMHGVPVGFFLLAALALLALTRSSLNLNTVFIRLDDIFKYLQYALLFTFALTVFPPDGTVIVDMTFGFILFLALGLILVSGYLGIFKKQRDAYLYFLGFSALLFSVSLALLSHFDLIRLSEQTPYLIELSLLVEATLFSFALSYRHKESEIKLRQNELLYKELSHRVKNNLQSIISIVSLQKSRAQKEESKTYLQNTIDRVRAIALIHEQLQHSDHVSEVMMKAYLSAMLESFRELNKKVTFHLECDEKIQLSIEQLTPLALVINELITNSLKYAFEGVNTPHISLKFEKNGSYKLRYEDNGRGYDSTAKASLGTLLITKLSSVQLKGDYRIETQERFAFSLTF